MKVQVGIKMSKLEVALGSGLVTGLVAANTPDTGNADFDLFKKTASIGLVYGCVAGLALYYLAKCLKRDNFSMNRKSLEHYYIKKTKPQDK
jgi:hypothetical protein